MTFTSGQGGTYTSSGSFLGIEYGSGTPAPYSGSFTGSGSFSYNGPILAFGSAGIEQTIIGPIRKASGTLGITNSGGVPITTTVSSDEDWLKLSEEFSTLKTASVEITVAAGSDYDLGWEADMDGLPLGTFNGVITLGFGGASVPVEIRNGEIFLPRAVDQVTGDWIEGATFHVTQPNSSTFTANSGDDGYPSPLTIVTVNGSYEIYVTAAGYVTSAARNAIATEGPSQFPEFQLVRDAVPNTAPTISPIADAETSAGSPAGPLAFTVGDAESQVSDLVVSVSSSNQTLLPAAGISLGGSGAGRNITLTPASGQSGSSQVTVTVSDGSLSASSSFLVTIAQPTGGGAGNPPPGGFTIGGFEDFGDNSKDTAKWGDDISPGNAATLTETSQRIEFTAASTSDRYRPWILNPPGFDKDWEMSMEVKNNTSLTNRFSETGIGLAVFETSDNAKSVQMELYRYREDSNFNGFYSSLNDATARDSFTGSSTAALRIAYDSATKVLTCYRGTGDIAAGYTWTEFASYGIAGSGGTRGNVDWGMSGTQKFRVAVFGYSGNASVPSGASYGDNFRLAPIVSGGGGGKVRMWQEENFDDPDSMEAALDFDGDFDGSSNLVEYAFGLDVNKSDPAPTPPGSGLPGLPNVTLPDPTAPTPKLRIEYIRRKASENPGIVYEPQFGCSLGDTGTEGWQPASGTEMSSDLGNGWERVVIEDTQTACTGKRFGRVKIIPIP